MTLGLLGKGVEAVGRFVIKNGSTICTIAASAGTVWTAVETGKATLEARDILEAHEDDQELLVERYETINGVEQEPLVYYRARTFREKVALTWRCFVVPVFLGGTTIALIFGAHHIDMKRQMAFAAAYRLSEEAAKEFRDKVTETFGEKKVHKVDSEIMQDKVNDAPQPDDDNMIFTGHGDQLMYDAWSGRYFRSSQMQVEKEVLALNKHMTVTKESISVNEYYEAVGLPYLSNAVGEEFGWNFHQSTEGEDIVVEFFPVFSPKQEPCIGVKFEPELLYTYGEI